MKMKHVANRRRSVSSRAFIALLALVLVIGCVAGGTVAWLVATSDTVTYIFYYPAMVKAKDVAAADLALEPIFTEISLPEHVTGEQLNALNNFKITVVAEAIQAGSFANAGAAWAAFAEQP